MTVPLRLSLSAGSVLAFGLVLAAALAVGPPNARHVFVLCAIVAFALATQSAGWDPGALPAALILSLPPLLALLDPGSPTWLIGPLGALLLVAGELNAMSWECREDQKLDPLMERRLADVGRLGGLGLVAAGAIALVAVAPPMRGSLAIILAAAAVAAVGWLIYGRVR